MRLRAGFLIGILFVMQMTAVPDAAMAQGAQRGACDAMIASSIDWREAQNKQALDERNRKYKDYDTRYQQSVNAEIDTQFQKWLAESKAIYDEFMDMQKMPHTAAKLTRQGALNEKLTRAREAHLKAQQEILLKWRAWRFEQIKAAQDTFEKAIKRNNAIAQEEIDRLRRSDCVRP